MARKESFPVVAVAASLLVHAGAAGMVVLDTEPESDRSSRTETVLWVEPGRALLPSPPKGSPSHPALRETGARRVEEAGTSLPQENEPEEAGREPSQTGNPPPSFQTAENSAPPPQSTHDDTPTPPSIVASLSSTDLPMDQILGKFLKEVQEAIEKSKVYPWRARQRGEEGIVIVAFSLRKDGEAEEIRLVRSSGHPLLDQSALKSIRNQTRFPKIPPSLEKTEIDLAVPIRYRIDKVTRTEGR